MEREWERGGGFCFTFFPELSEKINSFDIHINRASEKLFTRFQSFWAPVNRKKLISATDNHALMRSALGECVCFVSSFHTNTSNTSWYAINAYFLQCWKHLFIFTKNYVQNKWTSGSAWLSLIELTMMSEPMFSVVCFKLLAQLFLIVTCQLYWVKKFQGLGEVDLRNT